ncbi:MAG: LuxR C-terminal-related transcriptional regulator [Pseudanabaenaceae cyanobacterium bins.68]|nr:LuxR C-terminal-related transcriptional regulator [Pseudanabaenaceae cyanobacterium bins.68]
MTEPAHRTEIKLSHREQEILTLVVAGMTNLEIANQLFISVNTVKTHINGIYNKTGLYNRVQVAIHAVRSQLVE